MTLFLSLLGGALSLDATSVGQFLLARPLIASILTGAVLGDPLLGLPIGFVLEAMSMPSVPAGGARVPDGAPSAVVGTFAFATLSGGSGLVVGLLLAVLLAQAGRMSLLPLREVNRRVVSGSVGGTGAGGLSLRIGGLLVLDFVRGALLTGLGLIAFSFGLAPTLAERLEREGGLASSEWPWIVSAGFAIFWGGILVRGWHPSSAGWTTLLGGALVGLVVGSIL